MSAFVLCYITYGRIGVFCRGEEKGRLYLSLDRTKFCDVGYLGDLDSLMGRVWGVV